MTMQAIAPEEALTLTSQLCAVADELRMLVALLRLPAPGTPDGPPLSVFTTVKPSSRFTVSRATIGTTAGRVLPANKKRTSLVLQFPVAATLFVSDRSFNSANVSAIQAQAFGLSGHVGEVWAAATADLTATVIEQFED